MAFLTSQFPGLTGNATSLEISLNSVLKQAEIDIYVQVEAVYSRRLLSFDQITDFIFTAKSGIDEKQNFEDGGLPFKVRLKALLHTLVLGLPHHYPNANWSVPEDFPAFAAETFAGDKLTIAVIEEAAKYGETISVGSFNPNTSLAASASFWTNSARFRIRATESLEARLACK